MPALMKTRFVGAVTYLGHVADRKAALAATPVHSIDLTFAGYADEAHAGLTRLSDTRVLEQYDRGTEIRNTRQLSIVSAEELAAIAAEMGLDDLEPTWVGASMVIAGLADFTLIPPSSRLQFDGGTTLTIDMENRPCQLPARVIEDQRPGFGDKFKAAAAGRRGVTAWVEREGSIAVGDQVTLHVPDQPRWPHLP